LPALHPHSVLQFWTASKSDAHTPERHRRRDTAKSPCHLLGHPTDGCTTRKIANLSRPARLICLTQLGNYFGALCNWVRLQRTASPGDTLLFSVVGWHALTLPQDPERLRVCRREMIAVLLAVGIDPARSVVFHQDQVCGRFVHQKTLIFLVEGAQNPAHAELAWILNCVTPLGKLKRMTTWKVWFNPSRALFLLSMC
jgi:hypothetical protein